MQQQFGVIGLGVMGRNLALNVERNGFPVAVYNRTWSRTEAFLERARGEDVVAAKTLDEFVAALERPRRILLLVKAGAPVDAVIDQLLPLLDEDDVIIDGGNSHYPDTERRVQSLATSGLRFCGMGVSGGEEGALRGPSLMPGGDEAMYRHLAPILEKIAATSDSGPCVTHIGRGSAGHFVKMVHNGIEYGDMQLIAETWDVMRHALGLEPARIAEVFDDWNAGELASYLIEITARIVDFPDDQGDGVPLVDRILDAAGQKGTGKWTTIAALDLGVAIPTITAAVDARILSGERETRVVAAREYGRRPIARTDVDAPTIEQLRDALYAAKICTYAQGFDLMRAADDEYDYGLQPREIARIWKAGCIIRAALLDRIMSAYDDAPDLRHLLLAESFRTDVSARMQAWRHVVRYATSAGLATPALSSSLGYLDTFTRARGPANIIQAQRDYFGAHTYRRLDRDGVFHTDWDAD